MKATSRRVWRCLLLGLWLGLAAAAFAAEESSCLLCHGDQEFFGEEGAALIAQFAGDVHAAVGLSCEDCHGGNPDPALGEDLDLAMDSTWEPSPYLGAPVPADVPAFCGRCHSDPTVMRRYRPDARIDQEREYWTSRHGVRLAEGDEEVATCTSCHGVHGIRRADDPEAAVYPTRVAETCEHATEVRARLRRHDRAGPGPSRRSSLPAPR